MLDSSVPPFVYLFVCLFVCLLACLFVCLFVCLCDLCLFVSLSAGKPFEFVEGCQKLARVGRRLTLEPGPQEGLFVAQLLAGHLRIHSIQSFL